MDSKSGVNVTRHGFAGARIDVTGADEKTLEARMMSLKSATQNKKVAQRISRNKDTISTLLESLNTKPKFTKMVEYSLECLTHLAVDEVSIEELIDEGAVETLVRLMKLNPYNEKIQKMVNKCFDAFAANAKIASKVAQKLGVIPGLDFSLKKHLEPETLTSTATAMGKLLKHETTDVIDIVVQTGSVQSISQVIKANPKQVNVLGASTEVLHRVSADIKQSVEIFNSGTFGNVLEALPEFGSNERLVLHGVSLAGRIARTPEVREQMKKMGAVEILMAAVEMHPDDEAILAAGAKTLSMLSGKEDVGHAMSVSVGNNLAFAEAMSKLSSLLLVAENVEYLASKEGVKWLLSAMQGVMGQKGEIPTKILTSGCRAITRVATTEEHIYNIISNDGVKSLMQVAVLYGDEPDLVTESVRALSKLATRRENCEFLLKTSAVEACMSVMKKHMDNPKLVQLGLDLIGKVASHPDSIRGLVARGAVALTVETLDRHSTDRAIVSSAISVLVKMAVDPEVMGLIAKEGGLLSVVAILTTHMGDISTVKRAMTLIETAVQIPAFVEVLRKANVMEAITKVMSLHAEDVQLQQLGTKIMSSLVGIEQLKAQVAQVKDTVDKVKKKPELVEGTEGWTNLIAKVSLLGNLCMVDQNIDYLVEYEAIEILTAASTLPITTDKRSKVAAAAAQGLLRLAAHVAELERKRWEEEEKKRKEAEERRRREAEERRREEEARRREEEKRRREEEEKRKKEEEERLAEEERRRQELEAKLAEERRIEEEKRRQEEEERLKREEEERQRREEERKKQEEEERKRKEEERKKREEEEAKRKKEEEERRIKEEEERARREAEMKAIADEEERKRKEEEERLRREAEEKRRKEEEEARRLAEEERKRKEEEEERQRLLERQRQEEEERKRKEEEERKRKEEEARREEERRKREEELRRQEEERRKAEEAKRKAEEEERLRKEQERLRKEEEARRIEEEKRRLREEEERKKEEEEMKLRAAEARKKEEIQRVRQQVLQGLIRNDKVVRDLVQAALDDPDNEELAEYAAKLAAECAMDPSTAANLVDKGLIEELISLAKQHPLNEKVLLAVSKALRYLSKEAPAFKRTLAAGGVKIAMQAVRANMGTAGLKDAIDVLISMAREQAGIDALLEEGAIDVILEAIRLHPEESGVLYSAFSALCVLLISETVGAEIGSKGAIPLIISALRKHYADSSLCQVAVVLCDSLSSIASNVKKFLDPRLGTVTLVKWVADKYKENEILHEAATRLLATLLSPADIEERKLLTMSTEITKVQVEKLMHDLVAHDIPMPQKVSLVAELMQLLKEERNIQTFCDCGGLNALLTVLGAEGQELALFDGASDCVLVMRENLSDELLKQMENPLAEAMMEILNHGYAFPKYKNSDREKKILGWLSKLKGKSIDSKSPPYQPLLQLVAESEDPLILSQAVTVVGKLLASDKSKVVLQKADIAQLVRACRVNWKNTEFLKQAALLFGNLALSPELQAACHAAEVPKLILDMMQHYPALTALITQCAYALSTLSYESLDNCDAIALNSGLSYIVAAVNKHPFQDPILQHCIETFIHMAVASPTHRTAIVKSSGLQAVSDITLAHFDKIPVLMTCLKCLGNLASTDLEAISATIKCGAVQGIVAGMTQHPTDIGVIDLSLKLLTNLASELDEKNMKIMAEEGAVQAIVEVIQHWPDNVQLLTRALGCLSNLAAADYNAKMIINQGGIAAIHGALAKHAKELPLVTNALSLCSSLSLVTDKALVSKMVTGKIGEDVVKALETYSKERDLVLDGVNTLTNMAHNAANAKALCETGAVETIGDVVAEYKADAGILSECYEAMASLSRNTAAITRLCDHTFPSLLKTWAAFPDDNKVLLSSFRALTNLAVDQATTTQIAKLKLVPAALKVVRAKAAQNNHEVVLRALKALRNVAVAGNKDTKNHMIAEKTVDDCKKLEEESPDEKVRDVAAQIVDELTGRIRSKKAKEIFQEKKKGNQVEISQEIRNMLLGGSLLKKHSDKGMHLRHVKVDAQFRFLIWKDPKKKLTKDSKSKMAIYNIRAIESGRITPQLKKKRFGKFIAKEECCFTVMGRERTVDLECNNQDERDKWVTGLKLLVEWSKYKGDATHLRTR